MNGAENYLEHMRHGAVRRTAISFMGYNLLGSACCGLAYLLFLRWSTELVWQIFPPSGSSFVSAVLTQSGMVLLLCLRYFASYTAFSRLFSLLCAVLKGSGIGCAAAFLARGILTGITPARLYVSFGSMLILMLLCALSDLYADCFLTLSGIREHRIRSSLIREYTVFCGMLSGAILLTGILSAVFLS